MSSISVLSRLLVVDRNAFATEALHFVLAGEQDECVTRELFLARLTAQS